LQPRRSLGRLRPRDQCRLSSTGDPLRGTKALGDGGIHSARRLALLPRCRPSQERLHTRPGCSNLTATERVFDFQRASHRHSTPGVRHAREQPFLPTPEDAGFPAGSGDNTVAKTSAWSGSTIDGAAAPRRPFRANRRPPPPPETARSAPWSSHAGWSHPGAPCRLFAEPPSGLLIVSASFPQRRIRRARWRG